MTSERDTADAQRAPHRTIPVGCALAAGLLALLCVVPSIVMMGLEATGAFDRRLHGRSAGVAPPFDPAAAGLGVGGPRMPATADRLVLAPAEETKVLDLEVVSAESSDLAAPGDRCRLRVVYDPRGPIGRCAAEVECRGVVVFGGADRTEGAFECEASPAADGLRRGIALPTATADPDPRIEIDGEVVRVRGSAPSAAGSAGLGRATLVLSRTAPPPPPAIDPASLVALPPEILAMMEGRAP